MCSRVCFFLIFIVPVVIGIRGKYLIDIVEDNPRDPEIYRSTGEILQDLLSKVELMEVIDYKLVKIEARFKKMERNFKSQLIEEISKLIDIKLQSIDKNISKSLNEAENNLHNYLDNRLQTFEEKMTEISVKSFKQMDSKLNSTVDDIKTEHKKCANQKNISMPTPKQVEQIENCTREPEPKLIDICRQPTNCAEILKNKKSPNGVYQLYVPGFSSFDAYCMRDRENEDSPAWTVIQRRQNGEVNFTRNWTEYKNGFGNWKNGFWLGLDRMHALTSQKHYELLIDLEKGGGKKYFGKYDKFSISNEEDGYRLKLGEFSGDVDNQFSYQNNSKFSTWNVDNDLHSSKNCAKDYLGGWWYSHNCGWTHLNGEYDTEERAVSIFWSFYQDLYHLKYVQMAIRPKILIN